MPKHKEETALQVREDLSPAMMSDFAAQAGAGFEDMTAQDYSLPFIILIQSNSPQLDPTKAEYIEDAKQGMFLNTVTGELFREMRVIPCAYSFRVIERKPREAGGGFVGRYERGQEPSFTVNDYGKKLTRTGGELIDTAYHYVIVIGADGMPQQAVMIFRSTQLGKSKKWNAKMAALKMTHGGSVFTPPMYSSIYTIVSGKESNEKGSWFGYVIEREGYVQDANLLSLAKEFHETALGKKLSEETTEKAVETDEVM